MEERKDGKDCAKKERTMRRKKGLYEGRKDYVKKERIMKERKDGKDCVKK
jgi:hypothetical protein